MKYRKNPKNQEMLSILGYGCMRYTKKGGTFDVAKAEEEMLYALEHGVNYFDVAYVYRGCESLLGNFLAKENRRKEVYIATKLPHYFMKSIADAERIFQEQLKRLKTDYIDYYLIHMLPDVKTWERLKTMGLNQWLAEKKEKGQIRNLGFSYHGSRDGFIELIDCEDWDFTQIQYNYMDEFSQAGRAGLEYAAGKGIPVIIMEPLRGGRLTVDLPQKAKAIFEKAEPKRSSAEWALRWIWDHPGVTVVLSGMNQMDQVKENVAIAETVEAKTLSSLELSVFDDVKTAIESAVKIPCTGCGYCLPCPKGVDIPNVFRCYNVRYSDGFIRGLQEYFMLTTLRPQRSNAGRCVSCGKCKTHCPQEIDVPQEIQKVKRVLENPIYKIAAKLSRFYGKF